MSRVNISPGGLKRIVRSIEYTERITKNQPAQRAKFPQGQWNPATCLARNGATPIPVKVGNQAGSGTVRIWYTVAGLQTDSGIDVTAYNDSESSPVSANAKLVLSLVDAQDWYVTVEFCP